MGVEGYEAVAYRPVLDWFVENGVVGEHDKIDDRLLSQASENVLHWLSQCLKRWGRGEERGERERERVVKTNKAVCGLQKAALLA
jgi:hypothetical protein